MYRNRFALVLLLLSLACLQGCVGLLLVGGTTAAVAAHDRRTVGSLIDDQTIELKVGHAIRADESLEGTHINTASVNGVVLITGEAPTIELRDRVLAAVRTVSSVRRAVNEILIAPPTPASSRTNDSWITSKAKAKLIGVENLDSSQIKVITERSVVYLMGLVKKEEAELAATAAANVGGVERVVKIFEYLD